MSSTANWRAVLDRDRSRDGAFVYAVSTTGVYCRPSCPARRPRRDHVRFFENGASAEREGYRRCRRCRPGDADPGAAAVARACRALEARTGPAPTLTELSRAAGLSPFHLHRVFKRLTGVTPRQYGRACRLRRFKAGLRDGRGVIQAVYAAGFGSTSRVHGALGMTASAYRRGGTAVEIAFAVAPCPLGRLLVARTSRGICEVSLGGSAAELEAALVRHYPRARLRRDHGALRNHVRALLRHFEGRTPRIDLPLDVRATAFQERVWAELRAIPPGRTRTYGEIARAVGRPRAARAVARACASNRVALVVPCHRAVRKDGELGGYRWGVERKRMILEHERHS